MFFKKKNKEQKVIEEMTKKKQQIEKLKEEMNQMAKLVLKDGKLQKVEDTVKEEPKVQAPMPTVPSPPVQLDTRKPASTMYIDERDFSQPAFAQPNTQDVQQMRNQIFQENQRRLEQEQYQQQMYEQQRMQLPPMPQQQTQQPYFNQQPTYQPQQYQAPPVLVTVTIEVVTGALFNTDVEVNGLKQFMDELNAAIDGQSTFVLGNRVFNGRHIISYSYE